MEVVLRLIVKTRRLDIKTTTYQRINRSRGQPVEKLMVIWEYNFLMILDQIQPVSDPEYNFLMILDQIQPVSDPEYNFMMILDQIQ